MLPESASESPAPADRTSQGVGDPETLFLTKQTPSAAEPSFDDTPRQDLSDFVHQGENDARRELPPEANSTVADADTKRLRGADSWYELRLRDAIGGRGTFATVYKARRESDGEFVAIKVFHQLRRGQWDLMKQEVGNLQRLKNASGIIRYLDSPADAESELNEWFAMEWAAGGSLEEQARKQNGSFPVPKALRLFRKVVEAMVRVHALSMRHCDLKPANILLTADGEPRIGDFGQARRPRSDGSRATLAWGTVYYMPPEQADTEQEGADSRWDVYALGAVLYWMLTRELPRQTAEALPEQPSSWGRNEKWVNAYRAQLRDPATPAPTKHRGISGVDADLANIIDRCLELYPDKRYSDASAILSALERRDRHLAEQHRKEQEEHRSHLQALERQRVRRRWLVGGSFVTAVVLGSLWAAATVAIEDAAKMAKDHLTSQLLHSDRRAAAMTAEVLREKLHNRIKQIEKLASDPELLRQVTAAVEVSKGKECPIDVPRDHPLAELHELLAKRVKANYDFSSLAVVKPDGFFLDSTDEDRQPLSHEEWKQLLNTSYRWRDWFNGERAYDEKETPEDVKPTQRTHVSQPYRSTRINPRTKRPYEFISISSPLRKDAAAPVIGLVMGRIEREDFDGWLDSDQNRRRESSKSKVIVLNHRAACVRHPNQERYTDQLFPRAGDPPRFEIAELLKSERHERFCPCHDPLEEGLGGKGKTYDAVCASFSPFSEGKEAKGDCEPWAVIVRHDPAMIARAADSVQHAGRVAQWALGLVTAAAGALWVFFFWLYWGREVNRG